MMMGVMGGRLIGEICAHVGDVDPSLPGLLALIGAASVLAGTTRMGLTLTIILVEMTNEVRLVPWVMVALAISQNISNKLCESIDHILMHIL
eukprot:1572951-Prymnesium_polylepis.1